jgi:hydrogenase maturation protein HypF
MAEGALGSGDADSAGYPLALVHQNGLLQIDPAPMWRALLGDLMAGVAPSTIALRFHNGLSQALLEAAQRLARPAAKAAPRFDTVALSGGSFQNRILFDRVASLLRAAGFTVLSHAEVPANDGGLALGQAAIGAAVLVTAGATAKERYQPCV